MRRIVTVVVGLYVFAWPLAGQIPGAQSPGQPVARGLISGSVVDAGSRQPIAGAVVSLGGFLPSPPEDPVAASAATRRVVADGQGRFVFRDVAAGPSTLQAAAYGYLAGSYGTRRPGDPGRPIAVAEREFVGPLTIELYKPASIEGRLVDEAGEPIVRASVRAFARRWSQGRQRLTPTGASVSTDDRGVFRLSGLVPGAYVVAVPITLQTVPASVAGELRRLSESGPAAAQAFSRALNAAGSPTVALPGERVGDFIVQAPAGWEAPRLEGDAAMLVYPPVFFPAVDQGAEDWITLATGEERSGIELQVAPVRAVTVSGTVLGPDGPAAHTGVRLVPLAMADATSDAGLDAARTVTDATGAFTFLGVPEGSYEVKASVIPRPESGTSMTAVSTQGGVTFATMTPGAVPPPPPTEPTWWASVQVSVGNRPLSGVTLQFHEGLKVSGTLAFAGAAAPPAADQLQRATVLLRPVEGPSVPLITPGRADADGRFTTMGHPAGRYVIATGALPMGWHFQSATLGGRDVSIEPFELESADVTGVVLTLSQVRSEIRGRVRPASGTDTDAVVVVFPSDYHAWVRNGMNPRLLRTARVLSNGEYVIQGLPAGQYFIAAIPATESLEPNNPEFLQSLAPRATALTMADGESRALDVRISSSGGGEDGEDERPSGPYVPPDEDVQAGGQIPARDVVVSGVGRAAISGRVVLNDATGTPVRRARVALTATSGGTFSGVTATDADGRFTFPGLPAGRYSLSASRPGFLSAAHGSSEPGRGFGVPVAIAEGQHLTDVALTMGRGAVVSGRIVDEFGRPVDRSQVSLMEYRTVNGVRTLGPAATGASIFNTTDDLGRYRIFGLPPGEYVVAAGSRSNFGSDLRQTTAAEVEWASRPAGGAAPPPLGPSVGPAPFFYPGTPDAGAAVLISVNAGEERLGIDFAVGYVRTVNVAGRVQMPDGTAPAAVQLNMVNQSSAAGPLFAPPIFLRPTPDGRFTTRNVAPGTYLIIGRAAPSGAAPQPPSGGRGGGPAMTLWAQQEITIDTNAARDVEDLILTLAPGMTVSGRLQFDGTTPAPADLTQTSVRLTPVSPVSVTIGTGSTPVSSDGSFRIEGVTPGPYRVFATAPGRSGALPTWMLRHALLDGRDVADVPFEVSPGVDVSGVSVVFTDGVTELTGTITDRAGQPVPEYWIVTFPVDRALWSTGIRRRPAPQRPDTSGRFRVVGLPPGEYFLAALADYDPRNPPDDSFLDSLIPASLRITLAEGEKKVQDVRLAGGSHD